MAKKARTKRPIRPIAEDATRRVAIYIRRSTDEDHQPFSLEAQEAKLRAFVASQPGDWQIVAVYSDDASGATTDRPDLQKALRAARAGLFDTLLVYRVDRFSRRLRDLTTLLDDLDEAGIVFRSATEPFDTSTPVGRCWSQTVDEVLLIFCPPAPDPRVNVSVTSPGRMPSASSRSRIWDGKSIRRARQK